MNFFQFLIQDWGANKGNPKGRLFLILFRAANFCTKGKIFFYIGIPYLLLYKFFIQWFFTLEIPWNIVVGKNFSIWHGQAIILNKGVIIGENCTLRQCTTIGTKFLADGFDSAPPVIGSNVDIGSNVCIIGGINIGNNVIIGSGSVVVKSIAPNCMVAGNPAVEKKKLPVISV